VPLDPLSFVAAAAIVLASALVAVMIPARVPERWTRSSRCARSD
jgi:hypothetical protein